MLSMYIIIVVVLYVNVMAINVIVNQAEYLWTCKNVLWKMLQHEGK